MFEFVVYVYIIRAFMKYKKVIELRKKLLSTCLILCVFFFFSKDGLIGLPLYIYPMILSIILSVIDNHRINKKVLLTSMFLFICLLIPLVQISFGKQVGKYLILKQSNADALNIEHEFMTPAVNFTVIKHLLFFVAYILFIIINTDIFKSRDFVKIMVSKVEIMFHVLIIGLIVEWSIVNLLGGWNDRALMDTVFSMHGVTQKDNWYGWGSYNVALWLTERSYFSIIVLFYLIMLKKQRLDKRDWIWVIMSVFACYCTGSSSALVILLVYVLAQTAFILRRGTPSALIVMIIIAACCGYFLVKYYSVYSPKILNFINLTGGYGSGYWRGRSLEYGIIALRNAPLFGIGIGTIYAHGMLIETMANIGVVGFCTALWLHYRVCPIRLCYNNVVCIVYFFGISFGAYMVQNFTSPLILLLFIILRWEDKLNAREYPKGHSLLLVRR